MTIILIILLILAHWASDYIFQTKDNVTKKNGLLLDLTKHSFEYTTLLTGFVLVMLITGLINQEVWYYIINFWVITLVLHSIVDYITGKLIKHEDINNETPSYFNIFSIIITDQMIHLLLLFLTVHYLFKI